MGTEFVRQAGKSLEYFLKKVVYNTTTYISIMLSKKSAEWFFLAPRGRSTCILKLFDNISTCTCIMACRRYMLRRKYATLHVLTTVT